MLLLWLVACGDGWFEPEPARAPIPSVDVEGIVFRAPVTSAPIPPPTLWEAPLPTVPTALGPELYPTVDGICFGVGGAREAALPILDEPAWTGLLAGCDDPGFCAWAVSNDALAAATSCPDPALLDRFTAPGVPDRVVAQWFAAQARRGRAVDHPRLVEAADRLVRAADDAATIQAVEALLALPDGEARVRSLAAHAGDSWVVTEIERLLDRDPFVRDPLTDLDAAVRSPFVDAAVLVARFPNHRAAVVGALERCARDPEDPTISRRCLVALARADRAAAVALASGLDPDATNYAWLTVVRSLVRYPDARALGADLVARGLLPEGAIVGDDAVTPVDALRSAGRALSLDVWGDDAQGWLARRLAAIAGLDARIVVQPPLPRPDGARREPLRTQLAWVGGLRWRALARDYGSYPDVDQAVGFVNALLHERGAPNRIAVTDGEGAARVAVVGPPGALQQLADDGLLLASLPPPLYADAAEGYEDYGDEGYEATIE